VILEGTKTDHGEQSASRTVPVSAALAWMLEAQLQLKGSDCDLLFPTPTGRLWRERNFYRDVSKPAQETSGIDIRPHECRHSYVTHLRVAGVNDADLAEPATESRRCWRGIRMRWAGASRRSGWRLVDGRLGFYRPRYPLPTRFKRCLAWFFASCCS
jgi:hypothetical protein